MGEKLNTAQVLALVKQETGIELDRPRFLRGVRTGRFPKPVKRLTGKFLHWDRDAILKWLQDDPEPKPAPGPAKRLRSVRNVRT